MSLFRENLKFARLRNFTPGRRTGMARAKRSIAPITAWICSSKPQFYACVSHSVCTLCAQNLKTSGSESRPASEPESRFTSRVRSAPRLAPSESRGGPRMCRASGSRRRGRPPSHWSRALARRRHYHHHDDIITPHHDHDMCLPPRLREPEV